MHLLLPGTNEKWRSQIYYFHNFEHKDYNKFIGGAEQEFLNKNIPLKNQ
jgi:hypothetical protein